MSLSINQIIIDGVVKHLALKYDDAGKPETRWTLVQTTHGPEGRVYEAFWPCCAVATSAERLAAEIEDGQHIVITSAKLAYRKRNIKGVEQSRIEVLVWQIDRISAASTSIEDALATAHEGESH